MRDKLDHPDNENLTSSIIDHKVYQCLKSKRNWAARMVGEGKNTLNTKIQVPGRADHRPITCRNTMQKIIMSIVNSELQHHESVHKYMQLDQRGGMPGSMGRIDNLLIDKAILEDATKNSKNLSFTLIDIKEAFDSVSHVWLIEVLIMHKINKKLVAFVDNVMKSWTVHDHFTCMNKNS